MSNVNDGGPAFPQVLQYDAAGRCVSEAMYGMSLRQFAAIQLRVPNSGDEQIDAMIRQSNRRDFAGQAMAGLLANDSDGTWFNDDGTVCKTIKEISVIIARHSCTYADTLIEELNR